MLQQPVQHGLPLVEEETELSMQEQETVTGKLMQSFCKYDHQLLFFHRVVNLFKIQEEEAWSLRSKL